MVITNSNKLIYINLSEEYFDEYIKMYNDKEIQKTLFKKIYNEDVINNWVKKLITDKNKYIYSIIDINDKSFIGNIEIIIKEKNIAEIMISVTPSKQGKGYATEAIDTIINYGYKTLGIECYDLYVYKENNKAIHIYEKLGFEVDNNNLSDESIHMKRYMTSK